ncbi:MAG: hypothetical protein IT425_14785 [Pirellulales bacterium]|nr:hypothetical protein [Pirellulales bacterium]
MKRGLTLVILCGVTILVMLSLPLNLGAVQFPNMVIWGRQVGTTEHDISNAVAVDALGNLFLAWNFEAPVGENNLAYDAALNKYDLDGNLQWSRTFDSDVSDLGYALSSDGLGNAYLGGVTFVGASEEVPGGHADAYLMRIDSDGNTIWKRHFGSIESDEIDSISADGLGYIYVSGQTRGFLEKENAGLGDAFISKFDDAGNQLWTRQFGSDAADSAWAVSADELGNVFLSGTTLGVVGDQSFGSADTLTIKLDSNGETVWVRQWGSSNYDQSYAVQADGFGGAYIAGYGPSGTYSTNTWTSNDAFLGRYDADGNMLWLSYLMTEVDDWASSLALDEFGNIYVSGATRGALAGNNAGGIDSFLSKFSPDGQRQWGIQYGTEGTDSVLGLAVDANGGLYSSGLTEGSLAGPHLGGGGDAYLLKFDGQRIPEPGAVVLLLSSVAHFHASRFHRPKKPILEQGISKNVLFKISFGSLRVIWPCG